MRLPEVCEFGVTLQSLVHQLGSASASDGGLDDRQGHGRYPKTSIFDDVARVEITSPDSRPDVAASMTIAWDRHLRDDGCELRQAKPPSGSKAARYGVDSVSPDGGADTGPIVEGSVVDEVDTC